MNESRSNRSRRRSPCSARHVWTICHCLFFGMISITTASSSQGTIRQMSAALQNRRPPPPPPRNDKETQQPPPPSRKYKQEEIRKLLQTPPVNQQAVHPLPPPPPRRREGMETTKDRANVSEEAKEKPERNDTEGEWRDHSAAATDDKLKERGDALAKEKRVVESLAPSETIVEQRIRPSPPIDTKKGGAEEREERTRAPSKEAHQRAQQPPPPLRPEPPQKESPPIRPQRPPYQQTLSPPFQYQQPPSGKRMTPNQWQDTRHPPSYQQRTDTMHGPPPRQQMPPPPQHHQYAYRQLQQQQGRREPPGFRPMPIQQQQQQQLRMPPKRPPQASTLRMLWRRVERGLDELADFEEAVTGRAKQLLTIPSVPLSKLPGMKREDDKEDEEDVAWTMPSPPIAKAQRPAIPTIPRNEKQASATRTFGSRLPVARKADDGEAEPEKDDHEAQSGVTELKLYKMYAEEGKKPEEGSLSDASFRKTQSPLEDMLMGKAKMIRANGGASQPSKGTQASEQRPNPTQKKAEWRESMTNAFAPGYSGESHDTKSSRPPGQQDTSDRPRPSEPQPRRSPFGAAQRVVSPNGGSLMQSQAAPRDSVTQGIPKFEDEDSSRTLWGRFVSVLPPLPHLPSISKLMGRQGSYKSYAAASLDAWSKEDDEANSKGWMGIFGREKSNPMGSSFADTLPSMQSKVNKKAHSRTPPIDELLARCDNGKSGSLLSTTDKRTARSIGRSRAVLDVMALGFLLLAAREMAPHLMDIPWNYRILELTGTSLSNLAGALSAALDGWAYFALAAVFLCAYTNKVFYDYRVRSISGEIGASVESATEYGQLYLRLVSAISIDRRVPGRVLKAASSQFIGAVESARLTSFVTFVLSAIIVMTVSVVEPLLIGIIEALSHVVTMNQWRHWPLPWGEVGSELKTALIQLGGTLRDLVAGELGTIVDHPLNLAFKASLFGVLLAVTILPSLEQRRFVHPSAADMDEDEEIGAHAGNSVSLANVGISSASRLGLMSKTGHLEANLERWRSILPENDEDVTTRTIRATLTLVGYGMIATILLALPPLFLRMTGLLFDSATSKGIIRLDSLLDVSILLVLTLRLTWKALCSVMESSVARPAAASFLQVLAKMVGEFNRSQDSQQMNLHLTSSVSPTKGIEVRDLWAAHKTKRAWAVRGANLECRNGEVLAIIGDDGAGKTRLLTAISEAVVQPPSSSLSTTKVRGSVALGGVDSTKWDRKSLKKRLGLILNDVRTVTDSAELLSGLTLEEILEPLDGIHDPNEPHSLSIDEKSCMSIALQITGLSTSLLPKLPTKLSTVVTANEDELKPSPLRPRCNPLSPSEWSKLLFARVLAQTILDNDNTAKSSDGSLDKCLIGSTLLLDDVLVHMSEVEEANLMTALRRTGAATVLTSHKWATGRYADRLAVVKDGAIVEQGTHNELLARGPQKSVYASKWHAMTSV